MFVPSQICITFGEGRTFRGDVGKFDLEHTCYGLNPEMAVGDANDPAANRQGQRDIAVMQATGASVLNRQAASIEKTFEASMAQLIGVLTNKSNSRCVTALSSF